MPRNNIGISFMDSLLIAEFNENASVSGIGVYSPIGDGRSYSALWSSTRIAGSLGSGIVLKPDYSEQITGEYTVKYFVGTQESQPYTVKIEMMNGEDIYKLTWYKNEELALQGIGSMLNNSLTFAWGSIDANLSFHSLSFIEDKIMKMQTIKWSDAKKLYQCYTKSQ